MAVSEELSRTAEQPEMTVPFDWKPTVPVGLGGPDGPTVAVIVTDCPKVEGLGELVTVVVLFTRSTTCDTVLEVLGARVLDP